VVLQEKHQVVINADQIEKIFKGLRQLGFIFKLRRFRTG